MTISATNAQPAAPAAPVAAPTSAAQAAPETPPKRFQDVAAEKFAKHVSEARKAIALEPAEGETLAAEGPAPKAEPPAGKQARERDTAGKFKGKEGKEGKEGQAAGETPQTFDVSGAREMFDGGDVVGAVNKVLKTVLGKGIDEIRIPSRQWADWRHQNSEAAREIQSDRAKLQAEIQQAQSVLTPIAKAFAAHKEKDFDGIAKAFGYGSFSEMSQDGLRSFANTDPEVRRMRRELNELRQREQTAEQQRQQQAATTGARQARAQMEASIKTELVALDDGRISVAAAKPAFIRRTFEILREHYDAATNTSIPAAEAAEQAFEDLYGDDFVPAQRDPGANTPAATNTGRGGTPARQASAKAPTTNLNPKRAAESAPPQKIPREQLMAHYIQLAQRDIAAA